MSEPQGDNQKNRELYCPKCKSYSFSDESAPKCTSCKSELLTVVYNKITGHRITGVLR